MWAPHLTPSLECQGILCISLETCPAWVALPVARLLLALTVKLTGVPKFPHWPDCAFDKVEIPSSKVHICMLRSHLDKPWFPLGHPEHNSFINCVGLYLLLWPEVLILCSIQFLVISYKKQNGVPFVYHLLSAWWVQVLWFSHKNYRVVTLW